MYAIGFQVTLEPRTYMNLRFYNYRACFHAQNNGTLIEWVSQCPVAIRSLMIVYLCLLRTPLFGDSAQCVSQR